MAAPRPPVPAVLMDELVEDCLLRLPPEDPADLARAALVSRQWHRVVTGAVFRRRYIEFHRSVPLLGYIVNLADSIRFVSTSSSFRPPRAHRRDVRAIHSSRGRILLSTRRRYGFYLFVWDPITDKEWELPCQTGTLPWWSNILSNWDAALVVCAVGDGSCHLDCHFKVVVVGMSEGRIFSCFYSSETDSWSDRSFVSGGDFSRFTMGSVLVGNTLYFARESNHGDAIIIFKYDLPTHQMSTISLQCEVQMNSGVLIATEDGRLGVAVTSNSTICLWLREQGRLVESRVSQLHALPDDWVAAFADTGAGAIFLSTRFGYFTMDLNSGRSKKVGESLGSADIVPYMSFCTPASGKTVCTDEGPGACVVVSTDDEPRAGVTVSGDEGLEDFAVSTDEGPGDFVVSTDEGPGPSMSSA